MTDENTQKDNVVNTEATTSEATSAPVKKVDPRLDTRNRGGDKPREFKKNRRQSSRRRERPRSEFDQKMLGIRRVTRVSSGGRRFSFSVAMVIGDRKGRVGVGTGKGNDTALAIEKATKSAKKNMIKVRTTLDMSIPHDVKAKYSSAQVMIMPAKGRGIIAGSALRDILELAGVKDVNGKILSGSKNKLNIAQATLKALGELKVPIVAKTDTKEKVTA